MKMNNKKQLDAQRFLNSGCLEQYLTAFVEELAHKCFTPLTIGGYFDAVADFGTWLLKQGKLINDIDLSCIDYFAKYHCNWSGARKK
jgi:imidazole glycerol phosphate synthase subunit HisF